MALFSSKKKAQDKSAAKKAVATKAAPATNETNSARDLTQILKHARITEKASMQQLAGVYTFDISASATKRDILQAVKKIYNVTPKKVAVLTVRAKTVRNSRSGKMGVKSGGRKAYVYLKAGETISF